MSNNYNYPEITNGMGELTPSMWSRLMSMLRDHENSTRNINDESSNETLHSRVTELENYRPFFFAKLLRAHVLDHELFNPNVYEYAWVEVKPVTGSTDCCEPCLDSRYFPHQPCCESLAHPNCLTYLNYQGHWNWWEHADNTSWGETLANSDSGQAYKFNTWDLTSDYNPLQYPCIAANAAAANCNPNISGSVGEPNYPNINTIAYTKPAMNLMEAFNTADQAGGVDQRFGVGDFMLQAIGGGDTQRGETLGFVDSYPAIPECHPDDVPLDHPPCTQYEFPLKSTPIVMMYNIRESDGVYRQVFQEANSYDGTCVTC